MERFDDRPQIGIELNAGRVIVHAVAVVVIEDGLDAFRESEFDEGVRRRRVHRNTVRRGIAPEIDRGILVGDGRRIADGHGTVVGLVTVGRDRRGTHMDAFRRETQRPRRDSRSQIEVGRE